MPAPRLALRISITVIAALAPQLASGETPPAAPSPIAIGGDVVVRGLEIADGADTWDMPRGGTVEARLELAVRCEDCGDRARQLMLTLSAGDDAVTHACAWSGAGPTDWRPASVRFAVPDAPDVYEVTARVTSLRGCVQAIAALNKGRPTGAGPPVTLGGIAVTGLGRPPRAPDVVAAEQAPILRQVEDLGEQIVALSSGPLDDAAQVRLSSLTERALALAERAKALELELFAAKRRQKAAAEASSDAHTGPDEPR